MKTMKKLVAALLVLTMVLALTGSAFAGDCIKAGKYVKFVKNSYAYKEAKSNKKVKDPEVIVRKGSRGYVWEVKGSYAFVQLTPAYTSSQLGNTAVVVEDEDTGDEVTIYFWGYWFKLSTLKLIVNPDHYGIDVTFSNGGVGKSKPRVDEDGKVVVFKDTGTWLADAEEEDWEAGEVRISLDCKKRVEAKAKVWMHKTPSLSNNYGRALRKGDKVTYRRVWSYDSRYTVFYGIRYKGKCLWVSEDYTKLIK